MSEYLPTSLSAALFYKRLDPLNFKHLATTLNLILEPANIRFRVIHERPGTAAVLSCRKLHIALETSPERNRSKDAGRSEKTQTATSTTPRVDLTTRTLEISVGTGPLPHPSQDDDLSAANLLPLLAQMVVNHLLNMHPAEAVYWEPENRLMSPKSFLDLINAPIAPEPMAAPIDTPKPPRAPLADDLALQRKQVIDKRRVQAANRMPASARLHPSMINGHLISEDAEDDAELSSHIRHRFETARNGPKAAFIVSAATMAVAPLVGILLLIYNFMGGARLRQTALLAVLTAAVTLTSELVTQSDANATVTAPIAKTDAPHTAQL